MLHMHTNELTHELKANLIKQQSVSPNKCWYF